MINEYFVKDTLYGADSFKEITSCIYTSGVLGGADYANGALEVSAGESSVTVKPGICILNDGSVFVLSEEKEFDLGEKFSDIYVYIDKNGILQASEQYETGAFYLAADVLSSYFGSSAYTCRDVRTFARKKTEQAPEAPPYERPNQTITIKNGGTHYAVLDDVYGVGRYFYADNSNGFSCFCDLGDGKRHTIYTKTGYYGICAMKSGGKVVLQAVFTDGTYKNSTTANLWIERARLSEVICYD